MRKNIICLSFIASLLLTACHSKNDPMNELNALTEQLSEDTSDYTEEDWETVGNQLEAIDAEIQQYRDQYTDEEMKEIGRLKGKCAGLIAKKTMNSANRKLEDISKQAEGMIEGFMEGFGEDN